MNPQDNVDLEAITQNGVETNEKLGSLETIGEAGVTQQMETTEAVKGLEPALEAIALNTEPKEVQKVDIVTDPNELAQHFFSMLRGPQGVKGDTPVKGKDYFTEEDISDFLRKTTPVKGKDYFTVSDVDDFKKEITPVKGVDYHDGIDGVLRVFTKKPTSPKIGDIWIQD
jgi:hypothetical protein